MLLIPANHKKAFMKTLPGGPRGHMAVGQKGALCLLPVSLMETDGQRPPIKSPNREEAPPPAPLPISFRKRKQKRHLRSFPAHPPAYTEPSASNGAMDHQAVLRCAPIPQLVPCAGWLRGGPPAHHLGRAARVLAGGCGGSAARTAALLGVGGGGWREPPASLADPERRVQEKVARTQQDNELKESTLRAYHKEECIRSQAENELKEVARVQRDNELKESTIRAYHKEELQRTCSKAENELKERLYLLRWKVMGENQQVDQEVNFKKRRDSYVRKESQVQLASPETKRKDVKLPGVIQSPISNALRKVEKGTQDVPNHRKEPNTQKSLHNTAEKDVTRTRKEEKQRALLQLQWKVMGENQQVDQEGSSKKRRDSYVRKESQVQLASPETKRKDVKLPGVIQLPISNALRKVTHHEYEVETANGRITKCRKTTKSTVMFGEPNTQKSLHNTAEKDVTRTRKAVPGSRPHPANIRELFSEDSLNPYAEDPYAFG